MWIDTLLGTTATLRIRRIAGPGAYLAPEADDRGEAGEGEGKDGDDVLLLGSEIPKGAKVGDAVRVFLHLDSEGRPLATTREAKLEVGQVAFLEVTANTPIGSFVDWGLAKELLVPFAEQTAAMNVGSRYAIGLYVDNSGRLAGTMRVAELLSREIVGSDEGATDTWTVDEWVLGEAWRKDPAIGVFVIVEKAYVGLVPKSEPTSLSRGDAARFRVSVVHPDGKIELSLRGHAHEELAGDAERILSALAKPVPPKVGDKSSPEEIRQAFGLSKKAFKRAVGRLLKERSIAIGEDGFLKPAP